MELENTTMEMKISLGELNRFEQAELVNIQIGRDDITENRKKMNSLRQPLTPLNGPIMHSGRTSRREKGVEKLSEEIMAKNFTNLMENFTHPRTLTKLQIKKIHKDTS